MHAEVLQRQAPRDDEGLGRAVVLALAVHVLVALLFVLAWLWSPRRSVEPAAGSPVVEAALMISTADVRAAEQAMEDAPKPEPLPTPIEEPAEQDSVPPPQPIPEPRPQQAPVEQQQQAQERIPVPDNTQQEAARRDAISQEKASQEQEAKRRQEQIDLTERKRQQEAEQKQRLAQQQEAERQKRLDEIRRKREQAQRDATLAEQKLRQLADARARNAASSTPAPAAPSAGPQGQNGNNDALLGKYVAAIQAAVSQQWIRPESVALGTRCKVVIRQIPGGEVLSAEVQPGCAMDAAGQRSLEAAVLRAQPLPYRGFESVFNRTLIFNFEAQGR